MCSYIYELQDFYGIIYNNENINNTIHNITNNKIKKQQTYVNYIDNIWNWWCYQKELWFSHKDIEEITKEFSPNVNFISTLYEDKLYYIDLNLIIQYDQLVRHNYSKLNYVKDNKLYEKNRLLYFKFATFLSLKILNSSFYNELIDEMKIFILLCIRHNNNYNLKKLVLKKIYNNLEITNNKSIWLRFLSATIEDIDNFKRKNNYFGKHYTSILVHYFNNDLVHNKENYINYCTKINEILDDVSPLFLQHKQKYCKNYIDYDMFNNLINFPLFGDICNYFTNNNVFNSILKSLNISNMLNNLHINNTNNNTNYNTTNNSNNNILQKSKTFNILEHKKLAISISGGVDSMVLSFIIRLICYKLNIKMICIHICYGNRNNDEIKYEKYLLQEWCRFLDCKLYVREIDEIKRKKESSYREVYEKITRIIRFSFYSYFDCPILLGHNKDDCYENVFSNLGKQIHFDNLYGMKFETIESNIQIIRPMININKKEIYDFSQEYFIPYLRDSTPPWSKRGKTRDILIPAIEQVDNNILKGIDKYISKYQKLEQFWNKYFTKWLNNEVSVLIGNKNKREILININEFLIENYDDLQFWIKIWFELKLEGRPSNKSFTNLIFVLKEYLKSIEKNNEKNIMKKGDLNKKYSFIILMNSICIVEQ